MNYVSYGSVFVSRYESSAHMWLVLEYCVGGDLRTLLQQVFDTRFDFDVEVC